MIKNLANKRPAKNNLFEKPHILCMVVQIVQETLEDVPGDESTNVKVDSMITIQNGHFSEQKTGGTGNSSSFQ